MEIKIVASTAVELRQKIFELAFVMGMPPTGAANAPEASVASVTDIGAGQTAAVETEETKGKRHRRTKEQIYADELAMKSKAQENGPATTSAAGSTVQGQSGKATDKTDTVGAAGNTPTLDDVRAALQLVDGKKGMPGVVAMLEKFGVKRISAVPAEKHVEFIAACKAV